MKHYSEAAVERMMKVQEVILRAMTGKLRGWQAADILGVTERQDILAVKQMRRESGPRWKLQTNANYHN
jgi:hypothetical protein